MSISEQTEETDVEFRSLRSLGFPGYCVGSDGSVWSCRKQVPLRTRRGTRAIIGDTWRRLSPGSARGYLRVNLATLDGTIKSMLIHRLMLMAFVGPCPEGMEGCHRDDVRHNNVLGNLRWDTVSANRKEAYRNGGRGYLQ